MYSAGVLKQPFYLRVQVPRNLPSFRSSVWSQQAGHLVINQVYTVRPLIYEYSHRRIRHGVRDKASHRLHDQGIADDQTNAFRVAADASLREDRASVEPDELHQTDPTHGILNNLLHSAYVVAEAIFLPKSLMFGLPIAASTEATTLSKGF